MCKGHLTKFLLDRRVPRKSYKGCRLFALKERRKERRKKRRKRRRKRRRKGRREGGRKRKRKKVF